MPSVKAFFANINPSSNVPKKMNIVSIYDIKIKTLQGDLIELSQFKDKYMLFVNVASNCGFTPQYKDLQELYDKYKSKLQIIGVPCNQFGAQEPGDESTIQSFCEINYGVSFLITEKTLLPQRPCFALPKSPAIPLAVYTSSRTQAPLWAAHVIASRDAAVAIA